MSTPSQLSTEQIQERLQSLPHWHINEEGLYTTYKFSTYLEGADFTQKICQLAEQHNHHPKLILEWQKLRIECLTHSSNSVTDLDFKLAKDIQNLAKCPEIVD